MDYLKTVLDYLCHITVTVVRIESKSIAQSSIDLAMLTFRGTVQQRFGGDTAL